MSVYRKDIKNLDESALIVKSKTRQNNLRSDCQCSQSDKVANSYYSAFISQIPTSGSCTTFNLLSVSSGSITTQMCCELSKEFQSKVNNLDVLKKCGCLCEATRQE